jgi:hypothetical protein
MSLISQVAKLEVRLKKMDQDLKAARGRSSQPPRADTTTTDTTTGALLELLPDSHALNTTPATNLGTSTETNQTPFEGLEEEQRPRHSLSETYSVSATQRESASSSDIPVAVTGKGSKVQDGSASSRSCIVQ